MRELVGVADTAPEGQWCGANQAADALTALQHLVTDAITAGADTLDTAALAT